MNSALWLVVIATAVGTFMMRALPLLWMQRHLGRQQRKGATPTTPAWLVVLGPAMISAMFGVSLVPPTNTAGFWLATVCGVLTTLLVWLRTRSLTWPIFGGVAAYGLVVYLATLI